MKKIMLSVMGLAVSLVSCQKEQSTLNGCTLSMASIAGTYKITSIRYKSASNAPEQDYLAMMEPCEKDDLIKVNANGTADYQDAGTKCSPEGSYPSTWSLSGNTMTIDGVTGTIQSFDCRKLVITASGAFVPGDIYTVTYEKQ
ncbi:MAG: lipocalin family protein [Chitinophagales bacterium]|nr:lipocalin family protein [Chitinophagales bacterium]